MTVFDANGKTNLPAVAIKDLVQFLLVLAVQPEVLVQELLGDVAPELVERTHLFADFFAVGLFRDGVVVQLVCQLVKLDQLVS